MKKALLIGKFNDITKEISSGLSEMCHVQFCADSRDIIEGMLQMINPDIILLVSAGGSTSLLELIPMISSKCPNVPIIVIGREDQRKYLEEQKYLSIWLRFLCRPIPVEKICECTKEMLKLNDVSADPGKEEEEKTEKKQASVLLVDDSPALLRTMNTILSRRYKVTFVTSGTQAIASIAKNRPDIILLDYEMPVCDGKKTLQMLRSEESTKDIPVVFLTGIADTNHVARVMELKPDGYLLKPCPQDRLFATIEFILEKSHNEKAEDAD